MNKTQNTLLALWKFIRKRFVLILAVSSAAIISFCMAACAYFVIGRIMIWDDPISDTPCLMSPIDNTGFVTVNRFLYNGTDVTREKRAKLSNCRIETADEIQRANEFLDTLHVFDDWVCAALLEDGTLDILYHAYNDNESETASLNDALKQYMNDSLSASKDSVHHGDSDIKNEPVQGQDVRLRTEDTETAAACLSELGEDYEVSLPGNIRMVMKKIQEGSFMMGSPESELGRCYGDGETQRQVKLTKSYWIGETEVTQGQWKALMSGVKANQDGKDLTNPARFRGDNLPVESVSWNDAVQFCKKLNEACHAKLPPGFEFGLPTEAQWEYACRAGTTTALNNGKNLTTVSSACPNMDEAGWYLENSGGETHPVGRKKSNVQGLYDMHGNVSEWCSDRYTIFRTAGEIDPIGPAYGQNRVSRGGAWNASAGNCRSSKCIMESPESRSSYLGFRAVLRPVP